MPGAEVAYCPQCILFVFAAMGVYQYVVRDRIRNGSADENDDLLELDIEQMDAETQLMLLEMLSADHRPEPAGSHARTHQVLTSNNSTAA